MARRKGTDTSPAGGSGDGATALADRLHSLAIHLLRQLRREDDASGLTAPRLSALSVIVFGGPLTLTRLAELEQVRVPTMSRLVRTLEDEGLVRRDPDPDDARSARLRATPKGTRLLQAGRARRVDSLARAISSLSADDQRHVEGTLAVLEGVVRSLGRAS